MKKTDRKNFADCLAWLAFVLFTVLLPLVGIGFGWQYIDSIRHGARLRVQQIEATERLEELQLSADTEHYVCLKIAEIFDTCTGPGALKKRIDELNRQMSLNFRFLIWNKKGEIYHSTFEPGQFNADWSKAFFSLRETVSTRKPLDRPATENLRRIYGPQFLPELISECYSGRHFTPLYGDSTTDGRLTWVKVQKRFGLSIFFSKKHLSGLPGLKFRIREMTRGHSFAVAIIQSGVIKAPKWLGLKHENWHEIVRSSENPVRTGGWYAFKGLIRPGIEGIYLYPARKIDQMPMSTLHLALLLAILLLAIFIIRRSYLAFCCGIGIGLNIRRQLVTLFVLSNILSLSMLAVLAYDYLREYELMLNAEAFSKGMTYLQSIDEMQVAELSSQLRRLNRSLPELKEKLRHGPPDGMMISEFLINQHPYPFRLILVGSHTPFVGSEYGVMRDGEFTQIINDQAGQLKHMKVLVDALGKLGRYYLSLLNRETLNEMVIAQVELIAESLGQLRSIEMFQEFFAATGSFWQWGMGSGHFPAFINVFSLFDPAKYDYVLLYLWEPKALENHYISKMFNDINRNADGMRIMAVHEKMQYTLPESIAEHADLMSFATRLREMTGTEIAFCDWEGRRHLLMGLKCNYLRTLNLLCLSPVDNIEKQVREKFWLFFALGLVSLLVSLALGLIVARSILRPLGELQSGVMALQKQEFAYRLPDLGGDEFGNLARVFNTTLVDLEELHTASKVQEKLIDSLEEVVQHGRFSIFGGCRTVVNFGGDFFALNPVNERYYGFFIGDVAGTGVASTLVMAFVKACIIQLADLYLDPSALLARIDELLRSSSTSRQRKFMSLQYVLLDAETGLVSIASAGQCFPIMVASATDSEIIDTASTPVGSGRVPRLSQREIRLVSGQKIVFYTGGVYRNGGFSSDDLLNIVGGVAADCPRDFYLKLAAEFEPVSDRQGACEDQTIVVVAAREDQPRD